MISVMGDAGAAGDRLLGLATTRELLRELEVRGAAGVLDEGLARHRDALRALEHTSSRLVGLLPAAVLDYRAVGS